MSLQKAIEAPEPAGLCLVSEPSGAHQCDVVAHQIAKDTAEGRELAQHFECPIRLGVTLARRDASLATELLRVVPGLLGGDETRRYLVVFITPAELRGAGGFVGSYAELEAVDGDVDLVRSGRIGSHRFIAGAPTRTAAASPRADPRRRAPARRSTATTDRPVRRDRPHRARTGGRSRATRRRGRRSGGRAG